jgi:hypothetical protein
VATSYEAVVRFVIADAADDADAVAERIHAELPTPTVVTFERVARDLAADVRMLVDANDASQVQLAARERCQEALERAGLAGRVPELTDVDVRTSS